jgi:iron complex outermembrane receptor protein
MSVVPFVFRMALAAAAILSQAGIAHAQDVPAEDLTMSDAQVPVLTPTHMRQAVRDIPATVTILTADMLASYGILSIAQALRMVDGLAPRNLSWAAYDLKLGRQTSFGPPRATLMIDGIEVDNWLSPEAIDFGNLPVGIDDVDRIEVTRGPSAVGYGHALTTVIVNVVTKHPADVERGYARTTLGSFDDFTLFGRAGRPSDPRRCASRPATTSTGRATTRA